LTFRGSCPTAAGTHDFDLTLDDPAGVRSLRTPADFAQRIVVCCHSGCDSG
jgi:hypothetical protein